LTEEQTGGTTPEMEAPAAIADQASEEAVDAAIVDEPAETSPIATFETSEPPAPAALEPVVVSEDEVAEAPAAEEPEEVAEAPAPAALEPVVVSEDEVAEAPAAEEPEELVVVSEDEVAEAPAAEEPEELEELEEAAAAEVAQEPAAAEVAQEPAAAEVVQEAVAAEEVAPVVPAAPVKPVHTGPEPSTMEELLAEQDADIRSFKHGDVVEGTVVRIDRDEILVDIGAKSEGVVSNRELYGRHAESSPQLTVGDVVLVYVLQPESQEGHAVLSLRRAGLERKWRAMQEQFEAGVIIDAPVIDHNKGGLIVDCGIRGFVPISQIVDFPRRPQNDQPRDAAQEIAEKLQPYVGRRLRLKILEVNRKANRLILSEKVALYEERREKRDELFSSLQVGQKVSGTVRSIAPFGVFIDLGGIDGLVHKSELSWNKVNNPEAGYKVGDQVEAEVIDINHERGRISLSIRKLQPDPWHSTVADFKVGDVIDGTVTKLVNFGAFVRVRDGLEGLIHISELSHQRVAHPGDVVHEGQTIKLKIISLDSERHRLGLSLKQAEEPPARPPMPEPGTAPQPAAPRPERRPRPERGYSMTDAVQEPEGGIDNTLAAAFAQVRAQLSESEKAESGEPEEAPAAPAPAPKKTRAAKAVGAVETVEGAVEAVAPKPKRAAKPKAPKAEAAEAVAEAAEAVAEAAEAAAEAAPDAATEAAPDAVAEAPAPEAAVAEVAEAAEVAETVAEAAAPADAAVEAPAEEPTPEA
jgi:small subunit ribosomal protein S1